MSLKVSQLHGFNAKRTAAAAGGVSLSYVGGTTGTGSSVSFHGSATTGDLAIVADLQLSTTSGQTGNVPSGWTMITDGTTDFSLNWLGTRFANGYWKLLSSGDITTGSVTTAITPLSFSVGMVCHIYTSTGDAISAVAEQDVAKQRAANTADQTSNASGGTEPLIVVATSIKDTNTTPTFRIESPAYTNKDTIGTGTSGVLLGTKLYNSAASDHTVDSTNETGNELLMSCYLEVS